MTQGVRNPAGKIAMQAKPESKPPSDPLERLQHPHSANVFSANHHKSQKIQALLVEDQPLMRKAFKRILEPTQLFNVYECQSPRDAIQFLRNHAVELVILDFYLNQGSGLEVLNYIRTRPIASDVPVIFVTGEASRDDIVHAIELGVNDYVIKPFEPHDLLLKIKQVLGRYMNPTERLRKLRAAEADLIHGRTNEAYHQFKSLFEEDSDSPRVIVGLAQAESRLGRNDTAKSLLEHAITMSDMCFQAYALMADLLIQEGKKHEAVEFILRELSLNGKRVGRRMQLADLYAELHDHRSALEQLRLGLIDFPNDEGLLVKTARLHLDCGDHEKALHYFMKTRRNVPRSSLALKGITDVCLKQGSGKKAIQILTDFLNQKPNQPDVLRARAEVFEKTGQLENALADIDSCLTSEPEHVDNLTAKGRLLKKMGDESAARTVWTSLTRLDSGAAAMCELGMINFHADDFEQASIYFERAIIADATHQQALYHLALCYEKLGQAGKAKSICQQGIAIHQNAQEFKLLLKQLNTQKVAVKKPSGGGMPRAG